MTYSKAPHFVKAKHQVTTHTSIQTSSDSQGTEITLDGSVIEYTPHANANNVIYEIGFSAQRVNDWTFQNFMLEYSTNGGASWSDLGGKTSCTHGMSGQTGQAYRWFFHLRYVLEPWTGSRQWRIRIHTYAAGRKCDYHGLDSWDGASTSTVFTDSSLIMYSTL